MTSSRVENSSSRAARKVKLALMGPAFVAAIGYIDPGNFATNIQAGASFGYQLLWVVVWANLMAMLIRCFLPNWALPPAKIWPSRSATITRVLLSGFTGYRRKLSLWPPIWLNLSAPRLALSWCSACRFCRGGADRGGHFSDPDAAAARTKPLEKVIGGLLLFVAVAYVVELIFSQPALAPLTKGLVIPTLPNGRRYS